MFRHDSALPLSILLPGLRLYSESNLREHWARNHRRAKTQRVTTYYTLSAHVPRTRATLRPLVITITRIAPRPLDEGDNLPASAKAVQDGIADWLAGQYGKGQDRQPGLVFRYNQRRGAPREYGVTITIERGDP